MFFNKQREEGKHSQIVLQQLSIYPRNFIVTTGSWGLSMDTFSKNLHESYLSETLSFCLEEVP